MHHRFTVRFKLDDICKMLDMVSIQLMFLSYPSVL